MQELINTTELKKIDRKTMYKMIYELLERDMYYETKCLVNVFIEERTNEKEIRILNKLKELLFEYKSNEVKDIIKKL